MVSVIRIAVLSLALCFCNTIALDIPHTPSGILRSITKYSVRVRRDNKNSPGVGSGTLILINSGIGILTCAHVVADEKNVLVDLDEESKTILTLSGYVIKTDPAVDLALIQILSSNNLPLAVIASSEPSLYDEMYVVGSPVTIMRQSSILRLNTKDASSASSSKPLWTVSGSIVPGMSGSGVFDSRGRLVAVVKACFILQTGPMVQVLTTGGFVIPLSTIREFIGGA